MVARFRITICVAVACVVLCAMQARAVNCPKDMISIDGKYCVDKYEFPNLKGSLPNLADTWEEAANVCEYYGKRLCSVQEWSRACGGPDGQRYPYGDKFEKDNCNDGFEPGGRMSAGVMDQCASPEGVMDMPGNVLEWAVTPSGNYVLVGGSYDTKSSSALTCLSQLAPSSAKSNQIGFRCCFGPVEEPAKPAPAAKPAEKAPAKKTEKKADKKKQASAKKKEATAKAEVPEKQPGKKSFKPKTKTAKKKKDAAPKQGDSQTYKEKLKAEIKAEIMEELKAEIRDELETEILEEMAAEKVVPEPEPMLKSEPESKEYEAAPGEFPRIDAILKELDGGEPVEPKPDAKKETFEIYEEESGLQPREGETKPAEEEMIEVAAATDTAVLKVALPTENYFILGTNYSEFGNLVDSGTGGAKVSASGTGFTLGLKLPVGVIEHTTTGFKLTDESTTGTSVTKVNVGVLHAAFPLRYVPGMSPSSDITFGMRHFRNSIGKVTEVYGERTYEKNRWSVTPALDYLQTAVRDDGFGASLDVKYHLKKNLDIVGAVNTEDFYKEIINDHLLPYTPTGAVMGCDECDRGSASAGVRYSLKQRNANAWFMMYDIGDLDAPMAGIQAEF